MAVSNAGKTHQHWTGGRGFASNDPERQREVVGYVRSGAIEMAPASRPAVRSSRLDWMRVQPERDGANFEGSSSRRSR
jgi:hypothetical protein